MTKSPDDIAEKNDRALEQMLGRARPRPTPSAEGTEKARRAVREEWASISRRSNTRRRLTMLAAAASIAMGMSFAWQMTRAPETPPVQVATVDKSVGTLFVAGSDSTLENVNDLQVLHAGQVVVTDRESRAALAWGHGGSLRVDENTRLTLESARTVYLERGRIYFDSQTGSAEQAVLTINSRHGELTHNGTQYMAEVTDESLVVSVREGSVSIDGIHHRRIANEGSQIRMSGPSLPVALSVGTYGPMWQWIEHVTPAPGLRGKRLRDLIDWASREMGREYRFANDAVEAAVNEGDASGDLSQNPTDALGQLLRINDLSYRFDPNNGDIIISQAEN